MTDGREQSLRAAGMLAAGTAAALWGFVFVVPIWFGSLSTGALLAGRFAVFGLLSAILSLIFFRHQFKLITLAMVWRGLLFAFLSGIGMYLAIVLSVRWAGGVTASVITGLVPPAIAFGSAMAERRGFPSALLVPSLIVLAGVVLTTWERNEIVSYSLVSLSLGIAAGIVAIVMFAWFSIANARLLRANPAINPIFWANFLGLSNLPFVAATLFWMVLWAPEAFPQSRMDWALASLVLGAVCSTGGLILWNIGSRRLPQSFAGYFIVFEPIAGVVLTLIALGKAPGMLMLFGVILALMGLVLSVSANRRQERAEVRRFTNPLPASRPGSRSGS